MEGFINLKLPRWQRVLLTRSIAICPTIIIVIVSNNDIVQLSNLNDVLNVLQSIMLPFALLPILQFTSDKNIMGPFKSSMGILAIIWCLAFLIFGINVYLVITTVISYQVKGGFIALIAVIYLLYCLIVGYFLLAALKIKLPFLEKLFGPPSPDAPITRLTSESSVRETYSENDVLVDNEIVTKVE